MDRPSVRAGDPFFYAAKHRPDEPDAPHGCYDGWMCLGHTVEDPETGEEVEVVEAVPCCRCSAASAKDL